MMLLIDIGNSRLKWARAFKGVVEPGGSVDYRSISFVDSLREAWHFSASPSQVAIASVAANQVLHDVLALIHELWADVEPILPRSSASHFGVNNVYDQPEKLGVDRWLAMIAAHREYSGDICIVDCGTAITVDVVSSAGQHLGGLIAPGLMMMTNALIKDTALLHDSPQHANAALGTVTGQAIVNGALMAAVGLIEASVSRWAPNAQLILTGGDAMTVVQALSIDCLLDECLVLKGLAQWCSEDVSP